jgi:hypothetical protein
MKNILISALLFVAIPAFAQAQQINSNDCTVSAGDIVINAKRVQAVWYCPKAAMGGSPYPYICARMDGSNETIPMHAENPDASLKAIAAAMKRCQ